MSAHHAPVWGMVTIAVVQSVLTLMTISPTLYTQFTRLVDLAVVTNVIPYILSMASVFVILKVESVAEKEAKPIRWTAYASLIYSYYALYAAGFEPMMWVFFAFAHARQMKSGDNSPDD